MTVTWSGHMLSLTGTRRISVHGDGAAIIDVPPLKTIDITGEVISPPENGRFEIEADCNKRLSFHRWALPGVMDSSTLKLYYLLPDGSPVVLENGVDYEIVDPLFTGLKAINQEIFGKKICYMDYRIRYQRVDVIAVNAERHVKLFCGHESIVLPHWPNLPEGWNGIARVYSKFTNNLTEADIYPIADRRYANLINFEFPSDFAAKMPADVILAKGLTHSANERTYPKAIDYSFTERYSQNQAEALRKRIRNQKEFTLLYFGDSVTEGGDVDKDCRFTFLFGEWLRREYPETKFTIINSAIGGTCSAYGRERFAADVMKYKPDAVTIMFILNDFWGPDDPVLENHRFFLRELDSINAVPIFMTPNMNMEMWMKGLDNGVERIVQLAEDENRICVDVYTLWKRMREYGIPYETLLANGINHPDNISAGLFLESLKRLFKA